MTEDQITALQKVAESVMRQMEMHGCKRTDFPTRGVVFAGIKRLTSEGQTQLCRLVRVMTNFERNAVVADIDRMGAVVGWHLKQ